MLAKQAISAQPNRSLSWRFAIVSIATPRVAMKGLAAIEHSGPDGIKMDVIAYAPQVFALTDIDQQSLVTAPEKMTRQAVTPVKLLGVGTQEPLHPCTQVAARCFHDQMKMVAHQTEGMNLPGCSTTSASQQLEKECSIFVVVDDGLPPIASTEQMIDGTRVLDSEGTSHCSTT